MASLFGSSIVLGSQQRALFMALKVGAYDGGSLMVQSYCQRTEIKRAKKERVRNGEERSFFVFLKTAEAFKRLF